MLNVDKYFYEALKSDEDVMEAVGGRIFNPGRYEKEEVEDKIPYVIITYDSGNSSGNTEDEIVAKLDRANISALVVAASRDDLATLAEQVDEVITDNINNNKLYDEHPEWKFYIYDCEPVAGGVQLDRSKPCNYQKLTYMCKTTER